MKKETPKHHPDLHATKDHAPIDKREIAREVHTHGSRRADAPKDQSPK